MRKLVQLWYVIGYCGGVLMHLLWQVCFYLFSRARLVAFLAPVHSCCIHFRSLNMCREFHVFIILFVNGINLLAMQHVVFIVGRTLKALLSW